MIFLIGGAPRVGKSIVSATIAADEGVVPISTDDLENSISVALPEDRRRKLFPFPGFSSDPSENVLTPEEGVRLQIVAARSLKSEVERIIEEAIRDHRDAVIEGVHLLPEIVCESIERHGSDRIAATFVGSADADLVMSGMEKNSSPNDWLKGSVEAVRRQVAEFVVAFSTYVKAEAERNGLPYLERSDAFESDMRHVVEALVRREEERIPRK